LVFTKTLSSVVKNSDDYILLWKGCDLVSERQWCLQKVNLVTFLTKSGFKKHFHVETNIIRRQFSTKCKWPHVFHGKINFSTLWDHFKRVVCRKL